MAQGSRGRLALLGTGLLFCLGCMDSEPKPIGKPPLSKGPASGLTGTGSTGKPNQKGSGTTYGSGLQQSGVNTAGGRSTPPANNYFNTGSSGSFGTPTVPGQAGNGTSMAPPGVIPQLTPPMTTGSAAPQNDPYATARPNVPTAPPSGFGDNPQPPFAPGGPTSAFPAAPMAPPGAVNPYGGR